MGGKLKAEPDAGPASRAADILEQHGVAVGKAGEACATPDAQGAIQQAAWIADDEANRSDRQAVGKGPTHRLLRRALR
eukprot:2619735-Lingulodinium_polyedra.AAC.1